LFTRARAHSIVLYEGTTYNKIKKERSNTMKKTNNVKTQIQTQFPNTFQALDKVADLKATIGGSEVRVYISGGAVKKVTKDKKAVWTTESKKNPVAFLKTLIDPKAPKARKTKERKRVDITPEWIQTLNDEANKSPKVQEGDRVNLRVATSHGRPVCAHVDIHRGDEKLGTAGIHFRIGFATSGITDKWRGRINEAVEAVYKKEVGTHTIRNGEAVAKVRDNQIVSASGTVTGLLELLQTM